MSQAEEKLLLAYGKALGSPAPTLKTIKHIAHERLKLVRIDILRRSFIGKRLRFQFEQKGMRGMLEAARCIAGHEIPHLRDKYLALENKPVGSLGRAYFDFTRQHGFFFPGEPGGAPEPLVFHDCSHVLGGYDTTISEEACVVAFQSGYQNDDPLHSLLFVVAQFHLGMKLSPVAGAERMGIKDMEEVVKCFILGSQCKRDLSDHWDPWVDFDADVSELRERYNIQLRPAESTNTIAT